MNNQLCERMRTHYPPGTRVQLLRMDDPYAPVPSGTRGTVTHVDDMGQLQMHWDNGQSLALIPEEDVFRKLTAAELAEEQAMQEAQGFEMKME